MIKRLSLLLPLCFSGTPYLTARQSFDEPGKIVRVDFKGVKIINNTIQVKLPPFSVGVLTLK